VLEFFGLVTWASIFFKFTIAGIPIKTTLDNSQSIQYAAEIQLIVEKARGMIKNIDTTNDINFIRLRTKKHEVLIAPGN